MLLPQRLNESVVPFTSLLGLILQSFLEPLDLPEVLSLLQLDPISLQVRLFDALLALGGEVLDGLFSLLVNGHFLFLVFEERDQVIILLGPRVELVGHGPQLCLHFIELILCPLQLLPRFPLFCAELMILFGEQVDFVGFLGHEVIVGVLHHLELLGEDTAPTFEFVFLDGESLDCLILALALLLLLPQLSV